MKTICPHCNFEYPDIDDNLRGKEAECVECHQTFILDDEDIDKIAIEQIQKNSQLNKTHVSQKKSNGNTTNIDKSKFVNCPACGNLVAKKALICPKCGERITLGKCRNKKLGVALFIGTVICCLLTWLGSEIENKSGDKTLLACGIIGLIITLVGMAVCFTSPSGR